MQTLGLEIDADGIATLTFDETGSPVNTMTLQWQADLAEAVGRLERDKERIRGVLLASAKTTFFAETYRSATFWISSRVTPDSRMMSSHEVASTCRTKS